MFDYWMQNKKIYMTFAKTFFNLTPEIERNDKNPQNRKILDDESENGILI